MKLLVQIYCAPPRETKPMETPHDVEDHSLVKVPEPRLISDVTVVCNDLEKLKHFTAVRHQDSC